jgi:type II secretory pathway component GspD/PulD (secretin)
MNHAAHPRIGYAVRVAGIMALSACLLPTPAIRAASQSARVDEIAAELSDVQQANASTEIHQVQSVMAELAVLPSEENVARATLDILRRARDLRGESAPIRNEEIESLVADLAEVASPKFVLWEEDYKDAQAGNPENEWDDDAPFVPAPPAPAAEAAPAAPEPAPAAPPADAPAPGDPAAPAPGAAPLTPAPATEGGVEAPGPRENADPAKVEDSNNAINEALRELEQQSEGVTQMDASSSKMLDSAPKVAPSEKVSTEPLPKMEPYKGDPMMRPVNLDFREMELSNVVALLAHMAGINVVAGTDVTGTVTANLHGVPLRQAMDTALRLNGLGLSEEEGIYYIVPYTESVAKQRRTEMLTLVNAKADEVQKVLDELVAGMPEEKLITVSANKSANIIVVSGPDKRIDDLVRVAKSLDVAEPVLPTVTEAIKINYGTPTEMVEMVQKMLTPQIGQVAPDERSRHLIVTDQPVVVEQVRTLLTSLDLPVKEVMIDSMVVDVTLEDDAETGVDWLLNSVRRQSRRDAALGNNNAVGNLEELGLGTGVPSTTDGGLLNFAILSSRIDWRGMIQAEVRDLNGKFVSNPVVFTVENKPAKIEIVRDIPYVEVKQTSQGGSQTNTEFKQIGTILEVTPRVTHDNHIIADINAKESDTNGEFNGIPIEDRRSIETTMHMKDGETIFMGGLRKRTDSTTVRKVPVLGDVPVVNVLFRNNKQTERTKELLVFMTCRVMDQSNKQLTPHQEFVHQDGVNTDLSVNAMDDIWRTTKDPKGMRDPMYKFRRAE